MHHRFNVVFLLGGAFYFHREHLIEILKSIESQNFLISSLKQNVNVIVFTASTRALGINGETCNWALVQKRVSHSKYIFDLNMMWEELLTFLEINTKDSSFLMAESTIFPNSLLTKDEKMKNSLRK